MRAFIWKCRFVLQMVRRCVWVKHFWTEANETLRNEPECINDSPEACANEALSYWTEG